MSENFQLTHEQVQKYKSRKDELELVLLPENRKQIEYAADQGDLSENAEFDEAKEEQAKLIQELTEIKYILGKASIIKESQNKEYIEIGHNIKVLSLDNSEEETIRLLGSVGDGISEISVETKFGEALLGKKINETFSYDAKDGTFTYKVLNIY